MHCTTVFQLKVKTDRKFRKCGDQEKVSVINHLHTLNCSQCLFSVDKIEKKIAVEVDYDSNRTYLILIDVVIFQ